MRATVLECRKSLSPMFLWREVIRAARLCPLNYPLPTRMFAPIVLMRSKKPMAQQIEKAILSIASTDISACDKQMKRAFASFAEHLRLMMTCIRFHPWLREDEHMP